MEFRKLQADATNSGNCSVTADWPKSQLLKIFSFLTPPVQELREENDYKSFTYKTFVSSSIAKGEHRALTSGYPF